MRKILPAVALLAPLFLTFPVLADVSFPLPDHDSGGGSLVLETHIVKGGVGTAELKLMDKEKKVRSSLLLEGLQSAKLRESKISAGESKWFELRTIANGGPEYTRFVRGYEGKLDFLKAPNDLTDNADEIIIADGRGARSAWEYVSDGTVVALEVSWTNAPDSGNAGTVNIFRYAGKGNLWRKTKVR